MNPFKLIKKVRNTALKVVLFILIIIVSLALIVFSANFIYGNYQHYKTQNLVEQEFENYVDKIQSGEINSQNEGLQSYLGFSESELKELTPSQKRVEATKVATTLAVFDLKLDIKTDLEGNLKCVEKESFLYDDDFSSFVINPKWSLFYEGFSVFSDDTYSYKYLSNVYVDGNDEFRLNYMEDDYKIVQTYQMAYWKSLFFTGVIYSNSLPVTFEDRVQIVLPDTDQDRFADDIKLNYVVNLHDIYVDSKQLNSQRHEIPLEINNGELYILGGLGC